jgi:hypothetical protein
MDTSVRAPPTRRNPYNRSYAMPALSHELLITAVELVCYFCTAIGVALTFFFAART